MAFRPHSPTRVPAGRHRGLPASTLIQDFDGIPVGTVVREGQTHTVDWLTIESVSGNAAVVPDPQMESVGNALVATGGRDGSDFFLGFVLARPPAAFTVDLWAPARSTIWLQTYEDYENGKFAEKQIALVPGFNLISESHPASLPIEAIAFGGVDVYALWLDNLTLINVV